MAKWLGLMILIISLQLVVFAFALIPSESVKNITQINEKGPYIGLIPAHSLEQSAFKEIGAFQPDAQYSFVILSGRQYLVGNISERRVILVKSGVGLVNAAAVTQQLLDVFNVVGIIHFGVAGILDYKTLNVGDVFIPAEFINAGIWNWSNPNSPWANNEIIRLHVREFNYPREGDNQLGHFLYKSEEFYSNVNPDSPQELTWQQVNLKWLEIASNNLQDIVLPQCVCFEAACVDTKPKLVVGQRASTANIYVDNSAYRKFLLRSLKVKSADMESSAVVLTSLSNGYPVIVVRGLSNVAGGVQGNKQHEIVAACNAAKVVIELSKLLPYDPVPAGMGHSMTI